MKRYTVLFFTLIAIIKLTHAVDNNLMDSTILIDSVKIEGLKPGFGVICTMPGILIRQEQDMDYSFNQPIEFSKTQEKIYRPYAIDGKFPLGVSYTGDAPDDLLKSDVIFYSFYRIEDINHEKKYTPLFTSYERINFNQKYRNKKLTLSIPDITIFNRPNIIPEICWNLE